MQVSNALPVIAKKHKLVLLGESGVGKSSLVQRLVKDEWREDLSSTVGASFFRHVCPIDSGACVNFDIWDTAGQERYRSLASMYYRGAAAALVVYEIGSYETFEHAKYWVQELTAKSQETIIMLAGNKSDLETTRKVSTEEGRRYAAELNLLFMEVSARDGSDVKECFAAIARHLAAASNPVSVREGGVIAQSTPQGNTNESRCC